MGKSRQFSYSKKALDYLESIPKKKRAKIVGQIESLASNPRPKGCKRIKGLKKDEEVYRIRSGDYRVLYEVEISTIKVLDIGHRKDIYRNL